MRSRKKEKSSPQTSTDKKVNNPAPVEQDLPIDRHDHRPTTTTTTTTTNNESTNNDSRPPPPQQYHKLIAICTVAAVGYGVLLWLTADQVRARGESFAVIAELSGNRIALLVGVSLLSLYLTLRLVPLVMPLCFAANLWGKDINKSGYIQVPESLGIVPATVHLMVMICFQAFFRDQLGVYNAALISMCLMLFLGFADDVLNLRWLVKILFSFLAAVPLLVAYDGETQIVVPRPLRDTLGTQYDLGLLYHVYMAFMSVFCTNSINIFAGINGLETGQTLVIAVQVLVHNYVQLGAGVDGDHEHLFSIFMMLPFLMTTTGLFYYNSYPSAVFVGDTYTYFAGMTLAVAGILGHFSKTLMLFFIPQIINFILSIPQLIRIVPCPRHRLPRLNPKTGKLEPTYNYTLINLWLYLFGPMTEDQLCRQLLIFQACTGALGFLVRYPLARALYY